MHAAILVSAFVQVAVAQQNSTAITTPTATTNNVFVTYIHPYFHTLR
jgi:hypothetical protein